MLIERSGKKRTLHIGAADRASGFNREIELQCCQQQADDDAALDQSQKTAEQPVDPSDQRDGIEHTKSDSDDVENNHSQHKEEQESAELDGRYQNRAHHQLGHRTGQLHGFSTGHRRKVHLHLVEQELHCRSRRGRQ